MQSNREIEERIRAIEEEIQKTPYNKATQHHMGRLKAKLAQLREELIKKRSRGAGRGFAVRKSGDATVVLVGFPSVGKSTLINRLTDARSKTAEYEFTTMEAVPGIMNYGGARIQILDIPGVITGASLGRGGGKEILSVVRNADLILVLLDVLHPEQLRTIKMELYEAGIRLDEHHPRVKIKRTSKGGIVITSTTYLKQIDERTIKEILLANGIHSALVTIHEDMNEDRFIDAVMRNRAYIPSLIAVNKVDLLHDDEIEKLVTKLGKDVIFISSKKGTGLDKLRENIFKKLCLMKVYMKPVGREPDYKEPLILRKDSTVEDVCVRIHKDFKKRFRYARIWGKSVRFQGQKKGLEHRLEEGDVVSIIMKK